MRNLAAANKFLLAAAIAISLAVLVLSWNLPLFDAFAYRQTQTAISSYWMAS